MFGHRFFGAQYFGNEYFSGGSNSTGVIHSGFFGGGFFGKQYYGDEYFPGGQDTPIPPTPTETEDTHDLRTYKRYRRRLERAAKAADEYNKSKYIKEAVKAAAVARDVHVSAPVLEHIASSIINSAPMPSLDFKAIQTEITQVINKIDQIVAERHEEEEIMIMMSML